MTKTNQNKENSGQRKMINLALQGGGSHGAFTWGVLDYLLSDERVGIESISGTSAGAMNAVVVADGIMEGGNERAREQLNEFWRAVINTAGTSPIQRTPFDVATGNWNLDNSPGYVFADLLSRMLSPYQLNPLNINPLRDLVDRMIDWERVRSCDKVQVFVSATNVRTGRIKVFDRQELCTDAVMASACLPWIFQAVEIDGEAYWDGGYTGNPALYPFFYRCASRDVVIVQINPLERHVLPRTAREIVNRMAEVTFNAGLMRELRAIDFVTRLLDEGRVDPGRYSKILIHIIEAQEELRPFNATSKMNAEWEFLTHLKQTGRTAARKWLDTNYDQLGKDSTVDIRPLFA